MSASSSLLAAAVASLLAGGVRSLTVVDWKIPSGRVPYEPLAVSVGETVRFEYDPGHNVVLHPTGTCDDAGGTFLGRTSPTEYAFAEAGTYAFACDVSEGAHCSLGQIITITVTDDAAPSGEDAEGGGEDEAIVADDGAGEDPSTSIPAPPDEDPEDVLERFGEFFNEGEDRGLLEFRMKPYTVPSDVTTYVDFLFNIPEDLPGVVHIVAGDVINSQPIHLHHFVLTGCLETVDPAEEGLPQSEVPESCTIPLGGGWAVGGDFFGGIPPDSGEVFGAALGIKAISLNVHYTDGQAVDLRYPNDGANAIATDGFRMMYTTDLRPKTIVYRPLIDIGAGPPELRVPPNDSRYFVTKTCTVESGCKDLDDKVMRNAVGTTCGQVKASCSPGNDALPASDLLFLQGICPVSCGLCGGGDISAMARSDGGGLDLEGWRVDAVNYHAHLIGREMYTTLLPNGRSDVPIDLESQRLWLYDNQVTYPFLGGQTDESHFRVFPGDKIQASCVYDSTAREGPTSFGQSTYDEMCITQVSVVVDTPDASAGGGASLVASINAKTFNCALDDQSDIWGGSLDDVEDARDIWKDHPMSEADCTFPVGTPFGGSLSFKFDAFPTFEARCGDSLAFSICDGDVLDGSAIAGETCVDGSMAQADSNELSSYDAEGDATFGEQCAANGGYSVEYSCKDAEGFLNTNDLDAQTLEFLRTSWWQPKCCTKREPISICDDGVVLKGDAIAGETCNGGSMDGVDSNDASGYDTTSDATFEEQCAAKGGATGGEYTCKQLEDFFFNGPSSARAGITPEDLESFRVFQIQPKCCMEQEQDSLSSGDVPTESSEETSEESSDESSGESPDESPDETPVKEATDNGDAPGAGVESDGPDKAESGTFAVSPSLLFLASAVACLLSNV